MDDGDGNGGSPASGFTKYVTHTEFEQYCKTNEKEHKKTELALWGDDGRGGIIRAINDISLQMKIVIGAILFVQPIIIALVLKWMGL